MAVVWGKRYMKSVHSSCIELEYMNQKDLTDRWPSSVGTSCTFTLKRSHDFC